MRRFWLLRAIKVVLFGALLAAALGQAVTLLWNALMPQLFGLHAIHFWQAIGLLVLVRLLTGGFRGRMHGAGHWRHRMARRWEQMTPEERVRFKEAMGGRCGHPRAHMV